MTGKVLEKHLIHRCLVDVGNSVDILYSDTLENMGISSLSQHAVEIQLLSFTIDLSRGKYRISRVLRRRSKESNHHFKFYGGKK